MPSRFPLINFYARKSPYEYTHPVRIEPTTLNLVGTRIAYQATGDAGYTAAVPCWYWLVLNYSVVCVPLL